MGIPKPADVFDRDWEWDSLAAFARPGRLPRLGIVSGRRRQGKSYLLRRLCAHPDVRGLYMLAQEGARRVEDVVTEPGVEHLRVWRRQPGRRPGSVDPD